MSGQNYVLRSSCYLTVKQKKLKSRYCAAAAADAVTLSAENDTQISVNWGQKGGLYPRFEQYTEVFISELENWHVNTLSKTLSMSIGYRSHLHIAVLMFFLSPSSFLFLHLLLFLPSTFIHQILSDWPSYPHWACPLILLHFLFIFLLLLHEHMWIFNFSFISLSLLYDQDLFI